GSQDFETLHQRQAGVDHDGKLPKENGNVLRFDFAASECRQGKFLAFLADGGRSDLFFAKLERQDLLIDGDALAADLRARRIFSRKCKNWHCVLSLRAYREPGRPSIELSAFQSRFPWRLRQPPHGRPDWRRD